MSKFCVRGKNEQLNGLLLEISYNKKNIWLKIVAIIP